MPVATIGGLASDTNSQHLTKTFLPNRRETEIGLTSLHLILFTTTHLVKLAPTVQQFQGNHNKESQNLTFLKFRESSSFA
jgi:hypothetical protein